MSLFFPISFLYRKKEYHLISTLDFNYDVPFEGNLRRRAWIILEFRLHEHNYQEFSPVLGPEIWSNSAPSPLIRGASVWFRFVKLNISCEISTVDSGILGFQRFCFKSVDIRYIFPLLM